MSLIANQKNIDKCRKFYNRSLKSWLQDNDKGKYSAHSQGKSVVNESFMRTLKDKVLKYMASMSKITHIGKLADNEAC